MHPSAALSGAARRGGAARALPGGLGAGRARARRAARAPRAPVARPRAPRQRGVPGLRVGCCSCHDRELYVLQRTRYSTWVRGGAQVITPFI